jgi:hypothetical protein
MALKDIWTPKRDGIDDILSKDINDIAREVIETQANVEENSGKIDALETPANVTTRDASLSEFEISGYGFSVSDNTIFFSVIGGNAVIVHKGWINFHLSANATILDMVRVYVDGVLAEQYRGYRYTGEVKEKIEIYYDGLEVPVSYEFRTLQVKEFKGGILSDADYEKLVNTYSSSASGGGSADLGDIPERVEKLETPANSYYEAVTAEELDPENENLSGNLVSFPTTSGYTQIPFNGQINFAIRIPRENGSLYHVTVDDKELTKSGSQVSYSGKVETEITIGFDGSSEDASAVEFTKLEILKYKGGILSDEDYKLFLGTKDELDNHKNNAENPHNVTAEQVGAYSKEETDFRIEDAIYRTFGTVEAVFDEVHEYAETLGGDEA